MSTQNRTNLTTPLLNIANNKLENYITGKWINGDGEGQKLYDAVTGDTIAYASTLGIDFASALQYGREIGNPSLRKLSFHERGRMLKALATYLLERKEKFYSISYHSGATKADSWIDIEGGIGNLFSNASLRRRFPGLPYCTDGDPVNLSKSGSFIGHHIMVPKEGVAVHINAYNFPVWGMLEKCAVNWLAGLPAIVKPATITSYITQAVVKEIIESGILPEGALQLLCGSAGDLLEHVNSQDVVTFTGSKSTGLKLKSQKRILEESVPFTMETDSLNAIVLGEDVKPGSPEWDIFTKEVRKEMTVKAGQKCTAIRRIFVPNNLLEDAYKAIGESLRQTTIGNPLNEKVRMGSLASMDQREEVRNNIQKLLASSQLVYGSLDSVELIDADLHKGA
ncbi:MAG: aldehyde dehydrogenase family protein, partial [Candidatus Dadabacteria bacterium]